MFKKSITLCLIVSVLFSCSSSKEVQNAISNSEKYKKEIKKGTFIIHYSLPYLNSFLLKPENENYKSGNGFFGSSLGLDYYHKDNRFIHLSGSLATDFFLPVPAPYNPGNSTYESNYSIYLSLTNNYKIKRFKVGYGLSFSENNWSLQYDDNPDPKIDKMIYKSSSNYALGFSFPAYYQLGRRFHIGMIYRPSFYRFNTQSHFAYEHQICIDFGWKFRLN